MLSRHDALPISPTWQIRRRAHHAGAKKMEIAVARPLPRDRRRSLRQGVDGRNCAHARRPGDTACNASRHIADDMPIRSIRALRLRSEGHTSELQSLMRISYAVFCLNKNK